LYEYYNIGNNGEIDFRSNWWEAQTFTVGVTPHTVTSVKLLLSRYGSPNTVTVGIKATDGNGHSTGNDLTNGTTDGNTLTIFPTWREIALTEHTLSANTKYAIVVIVPSNDTNSWILWSANVLNSSYDGGNDEESRNSGSSWTTYTQSDLMFEVWGKGF